MSEIIQWIVVIAAVAISAIFLARKFKRQAKGKCDGCAADAISQLLGNSR